MPGCRRPACTRGLPVLLVVLNTLKKTQGGQGSAQVVHRRLAGTSGLASA